MMIQRTFKRTMTLFVICLLLFQAACTNPVKPTDAPESVPVLTTKSEEERTQEQTWPPVASTEVQPASESQPGGSEEVPSTDTVDPSATGAEPSGDVTAPDPTNVNPTDPQPTTPTIAPTQAPTEPASYPPIVPGVSDDELYERAYQLYAEKAVYITFDDGPSYLTEGLLDVLDQYNVKATFFVVYKPEMEAVYKDIVARGHAIGIHATRHDYDYLYSNFETWKADFDNMYNFLVNTIGYTPHLYRFPGGSIRQLDWKPQLQEYLDSLSVVYWDWNVVTEDGDQHMPKEQIMENAVQGVYRILPVILSHDGDGQDISVGCIPEVLQFYLEKGYNFRVLDASVPPVQQGRGHHWDYYRD